MTQTSSIPCQKFWYVGKMNHKDTKDTLKELLRNQHPKINDTNQ